jgi:ParB-like chromosome segregation protein Spo0J
MNIHKMKVFSAADVFPMMPNDDLQELSEDIKENGLREPLVIADVDGVTQLIDGRNRRAACKLAGVEPTTRDLNGEDPKAFVLSANIHRRHMTKGQRAMAVAKIYPEPEKGGRGKHAQLRETLSRTEENNLSRARTVLRYAPELVDSVLLSQTCTLSEAYETAKIRKDEADGARKIQEEKAAEIQKLRRRYSDLADKVRDDELTFAGAIAEADARDIRESNQIDSMLQALTQGTKSLEGMHHKTSQDKITAWLTNTKTKAQFKSALRNVNMARLKSTVAFLQETIEGM